MPCTMPSLLRPLRLVRVALVIVATVVFRTATESSMGVTLIDQESFSVEDFACADAVRMLPASMESPVILQIFNRNYLEVEDNVLLYMRQNAPPRLGSVYLVCLDEVSASRMEALFGLPCLIIKGVTTRRLLLATRVKMITCLVQGGHDVLVSDNDAVWLGDPIPDLRTIEGDMLFQRGNFPKEYGDPVYGQTLCDGFALYRAGDEGMHKFLELLTDELVTEESDQMAHNKAAARLHLEWDYNTSRSDMRRYDSTGVGRGVLADLPGPFVVALLPHNKYLRNCDKTPISAETLVVHCVMSRKHRVARMKSKNLWFQD